MHLGPSVAAISCTIPPVVTVLLRPSVAAISYPGPSVAATILNSSHRPIMLAIISLPLVGTNGRDGPIMVATIGPKGPFVVEEFSIAPLRLVVDQLRLSFELYTATLL